MLALVVARERSELDDQHKMDLEAVIRAAFRTGHDTGFGYRYNQSLLFGEKCSAQERTLSKEMKSSRQSWTRGDVTISEVANFALLRSRGVR
jgi:hypothetical protein